MVVVVQHIPAQNVGEEEEGALFRSHGNVLREAGGTMSTKEGEKE